MERPIGITNYPNGEFIGMFDYDDVLNDTNPRFWAVINQVDDHFTYIIHENDAPWIKQEFDPLKQGSTPMTKDRCIECIRETLHNYALSEAANGIIMV